jgi:hypothetical protein
LLTFVFTYLLQPINLFTYLLQPTHTPNHICFIYILQLIHLPTHPPTYLHIITYLPTHPPIVPIDYLATHPPTSLPTYLFTYPPAHPPTSYNIPTYVLHSFIMMCWNKYVKYKTWQKLHTFWWCGPLVKKMVYHCGGQGFNS